jgi:hypothetical protein
MRVRAIRFLLAVVATALVLGASPSIDRAAAGQSPRQPYLGLTYIDRTEAAPRALRMHIAQVDLEAPGIRFKLSSPSGAREVIRQTTLEFLEAEGAQIAINAHFFWPWPTAEPESDLIGIAASEGRVFSAFESPIQNYALVADAPGLNLDAANRATLVHRDRTKSSGLSIVEPVTLWNTVAGSAQIVTAGVVTIPTYGGAGEAGALLTPGGPGSYSNARSWYAALNARTAIAVSRDSRTLTLFTVDVRGGSSGMTVREVAEMLIKDYGAWHALNLDGGGSTSMAMADPDTREARLVNVPSDGVAGRAVGSSLAVFASPRR